MQIKEILLVWNADAGLRGHLHYALQKLGGTDECSLCEITHGAITEKSAWKDHKRNFGMPVASVYRNRLTADQTRVVAGEFPCVLARTSEGLQKALGHADIDACKGDLETFVNRLRAAIDAIQIEQPAHAKTGSRF